MRVAVNGVRLFVDVDGSSLVADGPRMREKPTLVLLHGGPGADHAIYKPAFAQLSDLAQIIYYDHRGNGRSDDGPPEQWTLDQWADDLAGLLDVLGIERPIIYGASFGGFVAQAFAARHGHRMGGLVLANTSAKVDFEVIYAAFESIGGPKAGAVARTYWSDPTPERRQAYFETCLPLYAVRGMDPDVVARMTVKGPVAMHFNGPNNEHGQFDYRAALSTVTCPTLVLAGARDPIMPAAFSEVIRDSLTNCDVTYHCLENAGHLLERDTSETFFGLLRHFIKETAPCD